MDTKKIGSRTYRFSSPPSILAYACTGGKKEAEGPLRSEFDMLRDDSCFGQNSWEKAESEMQRLTLRRALAKAELAPAEIDFVFAGDLLSQCIASTFGNRETNIPFFGVYGACSTMAESIVLAGMSIDGGYARTAVAMTSSHFCSAERQFRFPLEYGGQRAPTAQWTVTGAGALVLGESAKPPYATAFTAGTIVDAGIKDAGNMGAAMAPAAYDTLLHHFKDTGRKPRYYDLIATGALGKLGAELLSDMLSKDGYAMGDVYTDCGLLIYDLVEQDVQSGASGCGCSAAVLEGHKLNKMRVGKLNRVLCAATGAMLATVSTQQGENIP
ncbi:MAG: stage V sporulation protein AD [Clostridiales bacterium]|nr:stage V sporulation protein AD [Clostridiales bacterium]